MVAIANIIANTTKVMDLRLVDIKTDDVQRRVTPLAGRGVKQAEQKLKTSTLQDVLHLLRNAVPLTKLCAAD